MNRFLPNLVSKWGTEQCYILKSITNTRVRRLAVCSDVVVPIRFHTVYGQHFLQLLVGHTIPYFQFWSLLRQYSHLLHFLFFFYISTLLLQASCMNIPLELLQVKTQLKYVKINKKKIVKYAYKCLWVRYLLQIVRYSNITILFVFGTKTNEFLLHPLSIQIALFSVHIFLPLHRCTNSYSREIRRF